MSHGALPSTSGKAQEPRPVLLDRARREGVEQRPDRDSQGGPKRHRLDRDTDLVLLGSGDAIVLRKKADVEGILKDGFAPLLRASGEVLRDLWGDPEDDVWDDV